MGTTFLIIHTLSLKGMLKGKWGFLFLLTLWIGMDGKPSEQKNNLNMVDNIKF